MPRSHAAIQVPRSLSHEQLGKLQAEAEEPWQSWILVAARTGLRCGELLALRWKAIDLKKRELHVLASLNDHDEETSPKSHQARAVPLSAQAVAALEALKPETVDGEAFVFPTIRTRDQVSGALARISKAAGRSRVGLPAALPRPPPAH